MTDILKEGFDEETSKTSTALTRELKAIKQAPEAHVVPEKVAIQREVGKAVVEAFNVFPKLQQVTENPNVDYRQKEQAMFQDEGKFVTDASERITRLVAIADPANHNKATHYRLRAGSDVPIHTTDANFDFKAAEQLRHGYRSGSIEFEDPQTHEMHALYTFALPEHLENQVQGQYYPEQTAPVEGLRGVITTADGREVVPGSPSFDRFLLMVRNLTGQLVPEIPAPVPNEPAKAKKAGIRSWLKRSHQA